MLIAGPTASGKSELALRIAERQGGVIVNADALQVFAGWKVLTARPPHVDLKRAPHVLYGHVPLDGTYSAGHWLRDVRSYLSGARPIIVGGTGLYFAALTDGLADIPPTPAKVRQAGDALSRQQLLAALDPETTARIDVLNRARVQRAWEVLQATGRPLAQWQDETPAPLLPLARSTPIVLKPPVDWLNQRIALRFDMMLKTGALEEAKAIAPRFDPTWPSSKAIGAKELVALVKGELSTDDARSAAIVATRQYAKRQRTWMRNRMRDWTALDPSSTG